ncbi:MAG: serine/threonine-protein kinase [Acidobacteria bacterium]|nr:serine/threonine-protein kinase [Acidobacteriota bacterium]MCA1612265.1 serine/threonine-protein kinase [Acidobacteriota bacterium]
MTLAAGSRLGPYEILAAVGAGGMGEVYRVRDSRLDRIVAVKVLPAHLSTAPAVRQRFEREAKMISQLSHPHICAIYDVGREGEIEYLVMEYIEGQTLADRLARGPLDLDLTLRCAVEIADALDLAHRQGIVHRDLKPGNVMLTSSGVKLLDFGLAKVFSPTTGQESVTGLPTQANLTAEGTILGTLQYMAPEQLEGKEADARTDIFALGAVLYEMATGRKPFSGASQASLIGAILHTEPPPLSGVQPMSPPALERVVKRCLAKAPERRWQSARDLVLELEDVRERTEAPAAGASPARRRLPEAAGWVAAAVLLTGLLGSIVLRGRATHPGTAPSLRFAIPPPSGAAFQGMPAISPDGRELAFVATTADGRDLLFLRPLDSLEARRLEGTEGAVFPFWAPGGHSLAYFARGKLLKIDAKGGSPQILCNAPNPRGGSWGSRGTIVFSINAGGEIHRVGENGGESRSLPHLVAHPQETNRWPSFLPDGSNFLYFVLAGDPKSAGTYVTSLESRETTRLTPADGGGFYAAPGFVLYRSGDRLMAQRFDAAKRIITGEPFPVVEQIRWNGVAATELAVTASDTGLLVYQTGGATTSRLQLYDRAGRELQTIGPAGAYWEPTLSPDGRRIVVPRIDGEGLSGALWTGDLERGDFLRLSSQASITATPLWSGDGHQIVYSAFPTGEVYIRDPAAAGGEKLLFRSRAFAPLDDWSRDGRFLFYEAIDWRTFHNDVWVRDLKNGESRPVLQEKYSQSGARLSPDGRWLAYQSEESGISEVFVRSFPESRDRRQVSSGGGSQARWRADGRELFYISQDSKLMAAAIGAAPALEAGPARVLFQTRILPPIEARNHYDAAADGQRFVINSRRPEDASLPILVVSGWIPEKTK